MVKPDFNILRVNLDTRNYSIIIGQNLLADDVFLKEYIQANQVLIVTNETIAPLYLHYLTTAFTDHQCDVVILKDGEKYKNYNSLLAIYDKLITNLHHRDTTIIALGGGVIGDITGFATSTYQRGVNLIQIPTTLLAQVDSSVGGKTAINHAAGKNMIGCFYQPHCVIIDTTTLQTLPEREFNAGLGEIIKYAVLVGGDFLEQVSKALSTEFQKSENLISIITQCCEIKAKIVQQDECENNIRALLNLGHTIGHALESYTHYEQWLHGEAVGIGLYCAALLSQKICGLDKAEVGKIGELLRLAKLPYQIPRTINIEQLINTMKTDKKIKNNILHFILIKSIGHCYIEDRVNEDVLRTVLKSAVEGE